MSDSASPWEPTAYAPLQSAVAGWTGWRREAANGFVAACVGLFVGPLVGVVVGHLAPLLTVTGNAALFNDRLFWSETAIGADATMAIAGLVTGVVLGVATATVTRRPPVGRLLGLLAGSIGGSIVAAMVGTAVRVQASHHLTTVFAKNDAGYFTAPYEHVGVAKSALLIWPLAAVVAYAVADYLRGDGDA